MHIHWVLQKNLVNNLILENIKQVLNENQITFEEVFVIPFSDELPNIQTQADKYVFYGTTTLMLNAYQNPTYRKYVFFNERTFKMDNLIEKWGNKMLNFGAKMITTNDFPNQKFEENNLYFLRPNTDTKWFSGTVMNGRDAQIFLEKIAQNTNQDNNPHRLHDDTILINAHKKIIKEWRHFIVNQKVVASCKYLQNGQKEVDMDDIPAKLLEFVANVCAIYTPATVFVMDTALCEEFSENLEEDLPKEKYFILECNCFNATGFYQIIPKKSHQIAQNYDFIKKTIVEICGFLKNNEGNFIKKT